MGLGERIFGSKRGSATEEVELASPSVPTSIPDIRIEAERILTDLLAVFPEDEILWEVPFELEGSGELSIVGKQLNNLPPFTLDLTRQMVEADPSLVNVLPEDLKTITDAVIHTTPDDKKYVAAKGRYVVEAIADKIGFDKDDIFRRTEIRFGEEDVPVTKLAALSEEFQESFAKGIEGANLSWADLARSLPPETLEHALGVDSAAPEHVIRKVYANRLESLDQEFKNHPLVVSHNDHAKELKDLALQIKQNMEKNAALEAWDNLPRPSLQGDNTLSINEIQEGITSDSQEHSRPVGE